MENEIYLTVQQYAAQEDVSVSTVRRWIKQSLIFSVKIRGRRLIPEDEPNPNSFGRPGDDGDSDGLPEPDPDEICGEDTPAGVEIRSVTEFDRRDLRGIFSEYDDAVVKAEEIPVRTVIFRRSEDCAYQILVVGSDRA